MKFIGYLRLYKLSDVVTRQAGSEVPDDAAHNADVFAELIQCLDDRSLTLAMRDARDDGRKALATLREHYIGKGKPIIIALYTELT